MHGIRVTGSCSHRIVSSSLPLASTLGLESQCRLPNHHPRLPLSRPLDLDITQRTRLLQRAYTSSAYLP